MSVRQVAALVIRDLLVDKRSLATLMPPALAKVNDKDRGLLQELCFGSARWLPQLQLYINELLDKPLKQKDADINALLIVGAYQLLYTRIPDHAALSSTVEVCRRLKKNWATNVVNGVLRHLQRNHKTLAETLQAKSAVFRYSHPNWMINAIEKSWPETSHEILNANNQHPPFTLRLNTAVVKREDYLTQLENAGVKAEACPYSPYGIRLLKAVAVDSLPGFSEGYVSVQDEAAQLAAPLLQLEPGQRVLDACCAPGGKTCHILEREPGLAEVVALDVDESRLARVEENLSRLKQTATLRCGDAGNLDDWWNGQPFDRILLDAPCSATGVIRRHPDIKLLRTRADIAKLADVQQRLLHTLWQTLKPGGLLVYATCSIMPEENAQQVAAFLAAEASAQALPINAEWGEAQAVGKQLFPHTNGHDGFYYACLQKQ